MYDCAQKSVNFPVHALAYCIFLLGSVLSEFYQSILHSLQSCLSTLFVNLQSNHDILLLGFFLISMYQSYWSWIME